MGRDGIFSAVALGWVMASRASNRYYVAGWLRPCRGFELHQHHSISFQEHAGSSLKGHQLPLVAGSLVFQQVSQNSSEPAGSPLD